ncbi:MAG TPA: phosphotransferase [Thermoanaerobaculia bacterium]|nr:phosphotransferase [Thermoanaerobaculia bacterium]
MTVQWISERADSRIGTLDDAIVKQHREEASATRSAAVRARHEFEVLATLHAKMPAAFSVPRPLSLEGGTLTLEYATGTPLDVLIREYKRERNAVEELREPLRRAGLWLREMQKATRTGHHGDYWPGNIFIDADRVQVIDFEGYREDADPAEDVAYFLLQLKLLMPRHQRLVPALRQAFLDGYGVVDADALKRCTRVRAQHLLDRNAPAKHSFLIRVWMRRTLRNTVAESLR